MEVKIDCRPTGRWLMCGRGGAVAVGLGVGQRGAVTGGWQWLAPQPWFSHLVLALHTGVSHISHWAPRALPLGSAQPSQEQDGEKSVYEARAPAGSLVVVVCRVGSLWVPHGPSLRHPPQHRWGSTHMLPYGSSLTLDL